MQLASRRLVAGLRAHAAAPVRFASASAAAAPTQAEKVQAVVYPENYEATLSTVAARVNLPATNLPTLKQALTHKSFHHGVLPHNERMVILGQSMLRMIVIEHLYNKYPKLPAEALHSALEMYAGPESSAQIARSLGLNHVTLWAPIGTEEEQRKAETKILMNAVRGVVAAIYHERGTAGVREFVHGHVLSRAIDAGAALELGEPKRLLTALLKRQNRAPAQSRILKETGRNSHAAMFLVGVFSGEEQLATGSGQSIKVAETVAAKNALQAHFLKTIDNPLQIEEDSFASAPPQDTPPVV